jgi:hypothetical protein
MQSVRVEMNYLKSYCNLIRKAEKRGYTKKKAKEQELYVEGHHTFPVSIFGKNKRIVYLTAREHYIAHALLEKIYIKRYGLNHWKTKKMMYAFWGMNNQKNNLQERYFNSKLYEGAKIRFNFHSKNFKHTEDTIKKISNILKNLGDNHPSKSNEVWIKKRVEYMLKNNPMNNPDSIQKLCKFTYELTSPSGEIFNVKNMRKFCRENNLGHSPIFALISGRKKYYKGWTAKKLSTI